MGHNALNQNNTGTRLRRAHSVTLATANREEKKQRVYSPDRPIHEHRDSLFSSSSGYTNYRGFLNLALIMLALSTGRVALENVIKYGILVDPIQLIGLFFGGTTVWPTIITLALINVFVVTALIIEKKIAINAMTAQKALKYEILNCGAILFLPILIVFIIDIHPVSASFACLIYSVTFLKIISYHQVNHWCRKASRTDAAKHLQRHRRTYSGDNNPKMNGNAVQSLVQYPDNLTLKDMYYFLFAPTLCYELNFPRSERLRKMFLLKRIIEMIFLMQLNLALIQQWMVPTISNSLKPLQEMDYSRMLERLLKLSVPNHFIWLIWFYWLFHSCLNALAEVLRFADRQFYRDWWNSESVAYFWKNWNIPVHQWAVRHLYKPIIGYGYSKLTAAAAVFLVSAFFHEYLVSVPLKMFGFWAFCGMIFQIPFALFVSKFTNGQFANISVWISLIIGQPLCILACYHDYYVIHHAIY